LITRLRSEASLTNYTLGQLEAAQRKDHREVTLTAVQLTSVGSATREILERLRAEGVDFEQWVPMGPAS
jgi:hypothetical protein